MVRLGPSLSFAALLLWAAPAWGQGGDEVNSGDPQPAAAEAPASVAKTEGTPPPEADPPVQLTEPAAERPFFGVSLGAKGTVGGNLWTRPDNSPPYALIFDGTAGGWGGGGGLYAEGRLLWGYLGLEADLLLERNSSWHNVTWNGLLETDWVLKWTALRVPVLVKAVLPVHPVRVSLGVGPEIVAGLDAETEVVVQRGEELVAPADLDHLHQMFTTQPQTDAYLTVDLGLAAEVWELALTLDLRAGFNLTQPAAHDDRITYSFDGVEPEPDQLEVIASNSMDFRLLLGVAWETGFGL